MLLFIVFHFLLDVTECVHFRKGNVLTEYLMNNYKIIDQLLDYCGKRSVSSFIGFDSQEAGASAPQFVRNSADAVLFGHIADALTNETMSPIIQRHAAIMAFFRDVCHEYFGAPYLEEDPIHLHWKVSYIY